MQSEFSIKWKISDEGVPGGLSAGAKPKSYKKYKDMFDSGNEVRKIDDLRELRIPLYPNFLPFEYQREAVLRMLGRFRGKGIFGDQVGLGKTIEVGMTIAEFAERDAIKNVLLLCPIRLVFQWEEEMNEKFSTHFSACVVNTLDDILANEKAKVSNGTQGVTIYIMAFERICNSILSLKARLKRDIDKMARDLAEEKFNPVKTTKFEEKSRRLEKFTELYESVGDELNDNCLKLFDRYYLGELMLSMMIVDEADALLSSSSGKVLQIYRVAEHLSKLVSYRILLSATPIRRQLNDIYMLMKIVRPEQFTSREDFIQNYCFNKERLSDFKEEEISNLKGIIDQLFTRSRLSSKSVQQSLKPITIEEIIKLDFANFKSSDFAKNVRDAVWHGISAGENSDIKRILKTNFNSFSSLDSASSNYWINYIYDVFINQEATLRPFEITEEKNDAFRAKLSEMIKAEDGIEAAAVKFSLINFVLPPKKGHLILYKGEEENISEVMQNREARRVMEELGYGISAEQYEGFEQEDIYCEGKFSEFDQLVNGKLADKKVVVFSDNDAVREQFIKIVGSRALNAKGDSHGENYFKFKSDDPRYSNAVYFAVNGQEKGVNMQFCSSLIITSLSPDPNLVEQIVGRISRINQRNDMHIYVFAASGTLEHYMYNFYNKVLGLFSDWDGDNTFIIGGAVAAFLDAHPSVKADIDEKTRGKRTEDGEALEIGFPQIVQYIAARYNTDIERGLTAGLLEKNALWRDLVTKVKESMVSFSHLVKEFGDQEILTEDDSFTDI